MIRQMLFGAGTIAVSTSTWDAAAKGANVVLSNGNLDATNAGAWQTVLGTNGKSASGKYQFQITWPTLPGGNPIVGIADRANLAAKVATYCGNGQAEAIGHALTTTYFTLTTAGASSGTDFSWTTTSVFTGALDLTASPPTLTFYKDGVAGKTWTLPAGGTWYPAASIENGDVMRLKVSSLTYPIAGFADWG